MKSTVFIKNTVILTATSLILRLLGMAAKVWLAARIGAEGIGLYGIVVSVCVFAAAFGSAGVCTGVTRLIAARPAPGRREAGDILARAAVLTVAAALLIGGALFGAAPWLATAFFCDPRTVAPLRVFCFSLPFKGLAACVKGYFFGKKKTLPPSLSQIFEQLVRLGTIFILLVGKEAEPGRGLLVLLIGDAVGDTASLFFLLPPLAADLRRLTPGGERAPVTRDLLGIALPVTGSAYLSTGLHMAESLLIPAELTLYTLTRSESVAQYGALRGMALPLLFFPGSFLAALAALLLPELGEAAAAGQRLRIRAVTERAVGLTVTVAIGLAGFFFECADPLAALFFRDPAVGRYVRALAPIVPFMYLESVVAGMLKGLGRQKTAFFYNLFDSCCRLGLSFLLVPRWGMTGFLAVMTVSNITTASLSTRLVFRAAGAAFSWREWVVCPVAGAALGAAVAHFIVTQTGVQGLARLALAGGIEVAVFVGTLLFLGALPKETLAAARAKLSVKS